MPPSEELRAHLDSSDSEVRAYVAALEKENAKVQKRVVKLEAANVSQNNKIMALEEECEELRKQNKPPDSLDVDEALRISPALREAMRHRLDKAERPKNGKRA
jgi:hypothetical protein